MYRRRKLSPRDLVSPRLRPRSLAAPTPAVLGPGSPSLHRRPSGVSTTGPLRQVGSLRLPPAPPWALVPSSGLAVASTEYARLRALALAEGGDPGMAIRTELTNAMAVAESIDETVFFGINANTLSMDVRAWDMWEHVCRTQGTSPLRTAAEAREFPERNARLLACLLLHAFASGRPRDRSRLFIKPRSALAYPLAIVIAALPKRPVRRFSRTLRAGRPGPQSTVLCCLEWLLRSVCHTLRKQTHSGHDPHTASYYRQHV